MSLTLGILAGEASGDNLGAGLMQALQERLRQEHPEMEVRFVGIGGPRMQALGLEALASMDELAVNGFRDPILRLPRLLKLFRRLIREFDAAGVQAFVGIDFNVFNFMLEAALKKRGIATAHYVSPSVYAWRAGRTKRVAKSADLLLCLFPFEPAFYSGLPVKAEFVGHPLADEIDEAAGSDSARQETREGLALPAQETVLAVLPGSRNSEVALMARQFLGAAQLFAAQHPGTHVVIPCLRPQIRAHLETMLADFPHLQVTLYEGNARAALVACDVALVKSGTSTLECMLLHRPMVVSYRLGAIGYRIARLVVRTPYVALPNILAGKALVPELLQNAGTEEALAAALHRELEKARCEPAYIDGFVALHGDLRQDADAKAAAAVLRFVRQAG